MATGTLIFVILLAFLFHDALQASELNNDADKQRLDGIIDLDPNNPKVVAAAKFAVDKHNQDKKEALVFVKVVLAQSKPIAGITYNLGILAKDGYKLNSYHAFVNAMRTGSLGSAGSKLPGWAIVIMSLPIGFLSIGIRAFDLGKGLLFIAAGTVHCVTVHRGTIH
ncbi:hypothetical protein OSB04_un000482 [Centaurea solstitialis]|uniref:Cystatin domain-containing protein n=1 Tax=Centaurea solstitialis TaxID=347529 RepID=A0AA38W5V8_9ASTR|nr:hypothetical protein OSB04_un000482 [Centaurea solstitialis]